MDTSVTRAYWQDPINFERMLSIFVHLSWLLVLMNMGTVMPKFTATRIWGLCWVPATRLSFTEQAATRHFRMKTPTGTSNAHAAPTGRRSLLWCSIWGTFLQVVCRR
ncbi:hypothetical protein JG687_00018990 [Phytophthora cactorum]|uniref:Uncharacterized protein n=1 Tax=Phytophthora cactorum TaxID=29920 RepID=A0A8T1TN07_9STRA|nr:hypothetical protein JG687_00018990 [Phytophthora cactorum]